jgi:hypothetical protein
MLQNTMPILLNQNSTSAAAYLRSTWTLLTLYTLHAPVSQSLASTQLNNDEMLPQTSAHIDVFFTVMYEERINIERKSSTTPPVPLARYFRSPAYQRPPASDVIGLPFRAKHPPKHVD